MASAKKKFQHERIEFALCCFSLSFVVAAAACVAVVIVMFIRMYRKRSPKFHGIYLENTPSNFVDGEVQYIVFEARLVLVID